MQTKVDSSNIGAADGGGPRREYLTRLCDQIYSKLKLFVQSPNNKHNVGEERDKWIPNPKANSLTDLNNYYKLGMIFAYCVKLKECLEVNLPSIFWKYVSGESIFWEDIKSVNHNQFVCLEKISKMTADDLEYLDEKFTTFLGDGQEYELEFGGRNRKLTIQNRLEYIEMSKALHMNSLFKAFKMIKRGLEESIFPFYYNISKAYDLEQKMMGMNYVLFDHSRLTSMCSVRSRNTKTLMDQKIHIHLSNTSGIFFKDLAKNNWLHTSDMFGEDPD